MASNISVGTKGWADRINAAWRNSAAEIINTGRILLQAKAQTRHGDFEQMMKSQLDFSPQTARKLMAVAGDERVLKHAHGRALPDHWTTLYELTKLDDNELDQAFKDGTIRPDMERKDVPKKRKEFPAAGSGSAASADSIGDTVHPVADAVNATPQDDRQGGDSVVTETDHEFWDHLALKNSGERSLPTERSEPERLFDPASGTPQSADVGGWDSYTREFKARFSKPERAAADDLEANARLTAAAEPQGEPDRAFQDDPVDGAAGESPAIYSDLLQVRASQPARFLATGLTMAIRASKEVSPAAAAEGFPQELTPSADDVTALLQWMYRFEKLYRDRHCDGATRAAE